MATAQLLDLLMEALPPGANIHISLTVPDRDGQPAAPAAPVVIPATTGPADVEAMFAKMIAFDNAENLRLMREALVTRGLVPHVPVSRRPGKATTGTYLRWTLGETGPTICFLNSQRIEYGRGEICRLVDGLPGVTLRKGAVPGVTARGDDRMSYVTTTQGVKRALAAVDVAIKAMKAKR